MAKILKQNQIFVLTFILGFDSQKIVASVVPKSLCELVTSM